MSLPLPLLLPLLPSPSPSPSSLFPPPLLAAGENQCGNGLVEGDEPCDCGSDDQAECDMNDNCCTTNCTLKPGNDCRWVT